MFQFPSDFTKLASPPVFDFGRLVELQQRNFEALVAANTRLAEGAQEILRRHADMLQGVMQEGMAAARDLSAQPDVEKQLGVFRASTERGIAHARELAEVASKSGTEAVEILRKRASESVNEFGQLLKLAA